MSYTIKNTGGVLNIGQLMDFDGEVVDIATNKAAIQAVWKDENGGVAAGIAVAENPGDDYDCLLTVHGTDITGAIAETAWRTPYNTTVFTVGNISNFRVGDTVETQVDMVSEYMTVTGIDPDNGTVTVIRGEEPVALADSLPLVIARSGAHTVADYDADDTEIEVDDVTPYAIGMVVEALLTGEHLTITDIVGNVLTVVRGATPDPIGTNETLVPYGLEDVIAAGNSWDDYSTRTSFNVTDASTFQVEDTIQAAGSDEVMTVTQVDTANDVLTVERGDVPEDLGDGDVLTITNRWNNLPLGTHTIRLESSTDAILPRNILVDVLAEVAYNNLYSGTDTQALITGLNALGSRSLNDLYGSNNQLIP